ncbi:L,D-transpeptidase, partial [Enterobacter hormaechei subsp. steigerwaltii]|nr:L,D-transpeptidase [Enterobacter hormaechei subsp. steigerwaltii]
MVPAASAVTYPLPPEGSRLVGAPITITVPEGNTLPLEAFATQHGQGLSNMLEANPGVDPFLPRAGTQLVVPQQLILPPTVREGIVVNVAEMRLYYYPPGSNTVEV